MKYFYDEKVAHASYLVGCQATGEAIVVDPCRDIEAAGAPPRYYSSRCYTTG